MCVVGAGISNTPLIHALLSAGIDTEVRDKRTYEQMGSAAHSFEAAGAKLCLGQRYLENIEADTIFRTPGLMPHSPGLREAVARGSVLTSETEAFFDVCPCRIVAVTGSDGKTTTTSLIADMLSRSGIRAHTGGNIGSPLLYAADSMSPSDIAVLELSSFQLITLGKSPDISVVTNLSPNHLDVHSDFEEYAGAKRNIFSHQSGSGLAVFNYDNEHTRNWAFEALGKTAFFSRAGAVENGFYAQDGSIYESEGGQGGFFMRIDEFTLPGAHNIENLMAAFAAVRSIASRRAMLETAHAFRGVPHRIEFIRELRGARYYNDSIASSPSRTIAGLRAFDRKVILIAGGKDKGIGFEELGAEIPKRVKNLVLTGATAERIRASVAGAVGYDGTPAIFMVDDFADAVMKAAEIAADGDVVLLSPACTSFDRFNNFEERGDAFRNIVMGL